MMNRYRIIKRFLSQLLCFALMFMISIVTYADVVIEPYGDNFYEENKKSCIYVNKTYMANGKVGNVTLWKSPVSDIKVDTLINGEKFQLLFIYKDNNENSWGVVNYFIVDKTTSTVQKKETGWVLMSDVVKIYDTSDFYEDHKNEFKKYNGEFDDYVVKNAVLLWSYPGSDCYITMSASQYDEEIKSQFSYTYTDENGNVWVETFLSRKQGNYWICMNAPEDNTLPVIKYDNNEIITPVEPTETANVTVSDESSEQSISNHNTLLIVLAVLIVLVLAATMILVHIFWRKNKSNSLKIDEK